MIATCSTDAQETYDIVILKCRVMDPEPVWTVFATSETETVSSYRLPKAAIRVK